MHILHQSGPFGCFVKSIIFQSLKKCFVGLIWCYPSLWRSDDDKDMKLLCNKKNLMYTISKWNFNNYDLPLKNLRNVLNTYPKTWSTHNHVYTIVFFSRNGGSNFNKVLQRMWQGVGDINRYSLGQKQQTDYLQSHQRHGLNMESLPFKTEQGHIPHLFP